MGNPYLNIRDLVAEGNIELAMDALLDLSKRIPEKGLRNDIIASSATLRRSVKGNLQGVSNDETAQNKAIFMILKYVDDLEKKYPKVGDLGSPIESKKGHTFFSFLLKIGRFEVSIIFVLLIVGLLFLPDPFISRDVRDAARNNIESTAPSVTPPASPAASASTPPAPTGPTTTMTFEELTFDFGTVVEGEKVSHTYKFTNTGSEPLVIIDAKGSCGCTVPHWPREPINPGQTGEVSVEFNSQGKKGQRNQKVTITANTNPPQTFLSLTGTVNPTDGAAQPSIQVTQ